MRRPRRPAHELRAVGHDAAGPGRGAAGDELSDCHVLLAGGIHDARSAAMAAASAASVSARGAPRRRADGHRVPVHGGGGADGRDHRALPGRLRSPREQTALLESGPGHATRCLPSPFVELFSAERRRLEASGVDPEQRRDGARGAQHRPPAGRGQGRGPARRPGAEDAPPPRPRTRPSPRARAASPSWWPSPSRTSGSGGCT